MKKKTKKNKSKKTVKRYVKAKHPKSKIKKHTRPNKTKKPRKIKQVKKAKAIKVIKLKTNKSALKTVKAEVKDKGKVEANPIKALVKTSKKDHVVYLGIGSNVGDREEFIEQAVFVLSKSPQIKVSKRSTNYETEAEGSSDQPLFLNAAVEIKTKLTPQQLLEFIHEAENALGRERDVEWGPRTIDIDILLYDDDIISEDKLQIPHPLIHERMFALMPLAEIAPKKEHPVLEKTVEELLEERKLEIGEKYDDGLPGFKQIKKGTADDFERW